MSLTAPAKTDLTAPHQDTRTNSFYLPIEVTGTSEDHFWLVILSTEWLEAGRPCVQTQLRARCRHCNWGYNVSPFVTTHYLRRLAEETDGHVARCQKTGRTIDLGSHVIDPQI